jgi:hypothetical protein
MKKYFKYISGLALLVVSIVACETADQDVSPVISPDNKPVATFTPMAAYSAIKEGDTIVYNISIDKTIDRAITVGARVVEGTGDDDDIIVTTGTIAPYKTTTQVSVIFPQDWDAEATESLKLEFGAFSIADRYLLNPTSTNPMIDLTVANFVSDTLTVNIDWSQEIGLILEDDKKLDAGGYTVTIRDTVEVIEDAADNIDWDIFVSSADGFDITDPWSSNIVDLAATGNHPEVLKLIGLEDGEYVIWGDLWANGLSVWAAPKTFLQYSDSTQLNFINTIFGRQGTELKDYIVPMDSTQAPAIYTLGADDDGTVSNPILAKVIVADGKYTVEDYDGNQSGSYKSGRARSQRPANYSINK